MKVPIDKIIITEDRQRSGIGDSRDAQEKLQELAKSISKRLLHPVVLRDDYVLIAGFRRIQAAKLNGWHEIEARFESQLTDEDREELELEENIQRLDLSWQERASAIARLHEMRKRRDPHQSHRATAIELEKDQGEVTRAIQIVKMAELFPEIKDAQSMSQAYTMAKRIADSRLRTHAVRTAAPEVYGDIEERYLQGDSVQLIKTLPNELFNLILTDPPFGIDFDRKVNVADSANTYKDDKELYRYLTTIFPDLYRVIKPNGFLIWFCGFSWYEHCLQGLEEAGFVVDPVPDVWVRDDDKCFTTNPDQLFPKGYDIALHCYKGKPIVAKRRPSNVFRYRGVPSSEREQSAERPWELYADYIDHLTYKGELVADFFMGSGGVAIAAERLGRSWFGCELDPDRRARGIVKIKSYRPDRERESA